MPRPPSDARERLLTAAEDIILAKGTLQLTLDAVATEAGVSKGGLLYHFRSKDALIGGLIDRLIASFIGEMEAALATEPEAPGRHCRAMIRSMVEGCDPKSEQRRVRVGAAILAAAANDPALLDPIRKSYTQVLKKIGDDGLEPGITLTIAAALDGFLFWELFTLQQPKRAALDAAFGVLLALTKPK